MSSFCGRPVVGNRCAIRSVNLPLVQGAPCLTIDIQLPAVYESLQYGITVIISPLRTLILDQSLNLARTNVYVIRYESPPTLVEHSVRLCLVPPSCPA
jgi:hypothetical protein